MTEHDYTDAQAILDMLSEVSHLERHRRRWLLHHLGLYRGHHGILRQLWREDGVSQTELIRSGHVKAAAVSKTLHSMEEAGLVECRRDEADRRVVRVYLTDKGHDLKQQGVHVDPQIADEALAGFDADELAALESALARMRDNLKDLVPDDRESRSRSREERPLRRDMRHDSRDRRRRSRRPGRGRYVPDEGRPEGAFDGVADDDQETR